MVRVDCKSFRLDYPYFTDVLIGGEATQGFEAVAVIVGIGEVVQVRIQLGMTVVMIAFDGCLLDRAVHTLNLTVGPWMLRLGKVVFDIMAPTSAVEGMTTPASGRTIAVLWQAGKLDAIIGQYRMDDVGYGLN